MTDWATSKSLITGAGKGMGRLLTQRVLALGGSVVAWDVDERALAELATNAGALSGRLQTAVVNVMDRDAVNAAAEEAGPIDILVNNAGIVTGQFFLEETPEHVERVMGVNAMALFWTTRAFLPNMIAANRGHIVTVASAAGLVPLRRGVSYSASKHAAVGFHDSLRQELRKDAPNVGTTLVTPFYVNTGMFEGAHGKYQFLMPIVEADVAVTRIMLAVARNRHRVIMPRTAAAAYLLRTVPTRMGDFFMDQLGITDSMSDFSGPGASSIDRHDLR